MKKRTTHNGNITVATLRKYCTKHGIAVPNTCTKDVLEAAVSRAVLDGKTVAPDDELGCFGYWDGNDSNCFVCDFADDCHLASIGQTIRRRIIFVNGLSNPKVRLK